MDTLRAAWAIIELTSAGIFLRENILALRLVNEWLTLSLRPSINGAV
jgi:hypothetical protein